MILLGRPAIPLRRLLIILWHTVSVLIARAEMILCTRITLLRGFEVPAYGTYLVSFDAEPFVITSREQPPCFSDSKFSRLFPVRQPAVKFPANIRPAALIGDHCLLALSRIRKASLPQVLHVGLAAPTLWTKPETIANLHPAFSPISTRHLVHSIEIALT
jgi:hypothetical protein